MLFGSDIAYGTATNQTWVKTTDPEGRWITHSSNGFGQLVKVEEPGSLTTTYTYTPRGDLASVTDDDANQITISYDLLGRKLAMVDPDMGTWSYDYDANSTAHHPNRRPRNHPHLRLRRPKRMTQRKQGATVLAEWFYGTTTTGNVKGRLIKHPRQRQQHRRGRGIRRLRPRRAAASADHHHRRHRIRHRLHLLRWWRRRRRSPTPLSPKRRPARPSTTPTTAWATRMRWLAITPMWSPRRGPQPVSRTPGCSATVATLSASGTTTPPPSSLDSIRAGTTQLSGTWNLVDLSYTWDDAGNVGSITGWVERFPGAVFLL